MTCGRVRLTHNEATRDAQQRRHWRWGAAGSQLLHMHSSTSLGVSASNCQARSLLLLGCKSAHDDTRRMSGAPARPPSVMPHKHAVAHDSALDASLSVSAHAHPRPLTRAQARTRADAGARRRCQTRRCCPRAGVCARGLDEVVQVIRRMVPGVHPCWSYNRACDRLHCACNTWNAGWAGQGTSAPH